MADQHRWRDLEETDVYEVVQLPQPRPAPPPPPAPVHPSPTAPTWSVPPAPPTIAQRPQAHGAPAGWQAPYDTSSLAVLAATALLSLGIVEAIGFAFLLAVWDAVARLSLGALIQVQTVESTRVVFVTLLLVAVVQVVAAVGVFAHRRWARWTCVAISVPGTVVGTLLVVAGTSLELVLETWVGALLLGGYGFSFFGLIAGNSHFRRVARRA